jgi:hypothetical protein
MKHDKEVVVDVLTQFMKLSVDNINEIVARKLHGFMPGYLRAELESRMVVSANETFDECEAILQRYLNEDMTFENLVRALNENAFAANIRGQIVAHKFAAEFAHDICEYQLANADQIKDKLRELGWLVPEVEINTSGGQA